MLRRGGKRTKPQKAPKDQRIEALAKAVWAEARKDIDIVDMITLRNNVRMLYTEILKKEPK